MDIYETNEKFTELRKSLGLSRADVGYMLGIPYRTLQEYEKMVEDYMEEHNCSFEDVQKKYGIEEI